ncbi:DUF6334 family protein [Sphingobium scionense]|uniref:DUF6334 family protein n=2 Tax=Sphingobium scionense TaxID=1404341 RepID=UPI00361B6D8C
MHGELPFCMVEHVSFRFDWDEVAHEQVTDVLGLDATVMDDGSARWGSVAICVGTTAVVVTVEPDTDQVIVARAALPSGSGWERIPSFDFAVAKPLGWSWIGINSQGYKDSFTVAFGDAVPDALTPRCTFLAEASSLMCFDLAPRRA